MVEHAPAPSARFLLKPPWGMIADDLTGACDAGVKFANAGFRTTVIVDPSRWAHERAEMVVISTASRDESSETARQKVMAACQEFLLRGVPVLFKKIDSTLRGNLRAEIEGVMQAGGYPSAVINPAFPEMGRALRHGKLRVGGAETGDIDLPSLLAGIGEISVPDAETDAELETIAAEAFDGEPRPLLVGSGGLAAAAARRLSLSLGKKARPQVLPGNRGPAVFVVGSTQPPTRRQVASLVSSATVRETGLDDLKPADAGACLESGRHLVIHVPFDLDPKRRTFPFPAEILDQPWGGVVATGGDTAALVCRAAGIAAIELGGELLAGIPWGRPAGRRRYPWPLVTKGGSFGGPRDLERVARRLSGGTPADGRAERVAGR